MPTEISESGRQLLWVVIWADEDTGADMVSLTQVSSGHPVTESGPIEVFNLGLSSSAPSIFIQFTRTTSKSSSS